MTSAPQLEILLPVHNEADSIKDTIEEIYEQISPQVSLRFIICEDGSKDNTKQILRDLAKAIPMNFCLSDARKGYSRRCAMVWKSWKRLFCFASTLGRQCDPKDFAAFWAVRNEADVVLGWRVNRADNWMRKAMSGTFYLIYKASLWLVSGTRYDSCPYVLSRRKLWIRLVGET
jgi:glycosyltransferase involved in cell wall biosynthesis